VSNDDLKRMLESMQRENAAAHVESRRHFDVGAEALRNGIRQIAEAFSHLARNSIERPERYAKRCAAGSAKHRP
jgi:RNA polymerase-interacting CarD/CdnL/TRCF family regulator